MILIVVATVGALAGGLIGAVLGVTLYVMYVLFVTGLEWDQGDE